MNLRTGGAHLYRSAAQFDAVCFAYRPFRVSIITHLEKRKPSRLIRFEIGHHLKPLNFTVQFEDGTNVLFSSAGTEVSNKNIVHNEFLYLSVSS
jgi:hypothetical protein